MEQLKKLAAAPGQMVLFFVNKLPPQVQAGATTKLKINANQMGAEEFSKAAQENPQKYIALPGSLVQMQKPAKVEGVIFY